MSRKIDLKQYLKDQYNRCVGFFPFFARGRRTRGLSDVRAEEDRGGKTEEVEVQQLDDTKVD